VAPRGLEPRTY